MRSRRSRPSIDGGNLGTGVTRRGDDCDVRSAGEQKIQVRDPVRYKAHPRRPRPARFPYLFFFASKILLVMESTTNQHWWAFASPAFLFGLASPIQGSGANGRCLTSLQGAAGGISSATAFFCISRDGGVHLGAAERPRTASIVRGTPFPHDTHSRLETSTGAHTVVVAVRCNVSALPPPPLASQFSLMQSTPTGEHGQAGSEDMVVVVLGDRDVSAAALLPLSQRSNSRGAGGR